MKSYRRGRGDYEFKYESEECIDALFKCKHSKNLDELKENISKVMKTRTTYKYRRDKDGNTRWIS